MVRLRSRSSAGFGLACLLGFAAAGLVPGGVSAGEGKAQSGAKPRGEYGPDPLSVQRSGKGYRYPKDGWIVVHIEGEPYERGFQHGRLLGPEIARYVEMLATKRGKENPGANWKAVRLLVDAAFLRKFDPEFLEEMKGIAAGANEAGATFDGRPLDLLDVASLNADIEIEFLDAALEATATGLEGKVFSSPDRSTPPSLTEPHCSAFAATGPATADGKIVFGHITMFNIAFAGHFNVWLDIVPTSGHRVVMQTYPGGIQSGLDYYLNDAGLIVSETTIGQTKFDLSGDPLASRIRKAVQYADSIDRVVEILTRANNGLYSNEWMIADTKTDEIAMYELGTHKSRLWRSGKDEWFGGTRGFYWGCNNAKDLAVRMETMPGVAGRPEKTTWVPSDRDIAWNALFAKHKGKIDAGFGFEAYSTPPLVAFASLDAKFTTSAMAKELKVHAVFGPPMGRTWDPTPADKNRVPKVSPLVSNDWTVLTVDAPPAPPAKPARDLETTVEILPTELKGETLPAWHGTILAATDADTWLEAGFADFERYVALDRDLRAASLHGDPIEPDADHLATLAYRPRANRWRATVRRGLDVPLVATRAELTDRTWYEIAAGKGFEVLVAIRAELTPDTFAPFMDGFGRSHAGKAVTTAEFLAAAEAALGHPLSPKTRAMLTANARPEAPSWSIDAFESEPERTMIVYGTRRDTAAQREAAERLQRQIARRWPNLYPPIVSDEAATPDDLKSHHVLLIGRPETNVAFASVGGSLPLAYGPASFTVRDETYASASTAVLAAGPNPLNERFSVVAFSGLGADATWHAVESLPPARSDFASNVLLLVRDHHPRALVVRPGEFNPIVDRRVDARP